MIPLLHFAIMGASCSATAKSVDLQTVNASYTSISDDGLAAVSSCTALSTLQIAGCSLVTDQGVANMFGAAAAATMKAWLAAAVPASKLFEEGIPIPPKKLSQMDYLRILDLSGCTSLTDYSLVIIGLNCPQLGGISLTGNGKFSDTGIIALSRGCNRLRRLACNNCAGLTDIGMKNIINYCPKLASVCVHLSSY